MLRDLGNLWASPQFPGMAGMDKVDFTNTSFVNPYAHSGLKGGIKKTKEKDELKGSRKTLFSKILDDAESQLTELGPLKNIRPSEEALTQLMDAVHSAGSDLIERPFASEILQYKRAVRNFVHYVVDNAYSLDRAQVRRRGKTKIHVQIHIIDQKLEELAAAILSGQSTQLTRVSKLDEIKGLLVDLTITGVIKERDD